jgi:TRAP-type C4-dicarboxylate transport system permease small subunit
MRREACVANERCEKLSKTLSTWLEKISTTALAVIMVLTGIDIIGRAFGMPVPGTFEVVTFAGGLIIGLALPASQMSGSQVRIELEPLTNKFPKKLQMFLTIATRVIGIALCLLISYALLIMGNDYVKSKELTAVLKLPFYPIMYAMSMAFIAEAVALFREIMMTGGGSAHE